MRGLPPRPIRGFCLQAATCIRRARWHSGARSSHVEWFEGNYQEYEADRHKRLGAEADRRTGCGSRSSWGTRPAAS